MIMGILDMAKIITVAYISKDLRAHGFLGRDNEVGFSAEDFNKGCEAVKS